VQVEFSYDKFGAENTEYICSTRKEAILVITSVKQISYWQADCRLGVQATKIVPKLQLKKQRDCVWTALSQ
jgi:hypothetical protein